MSEPSPSLLFSADSIVDTVREPLLVLSADLRVRKANRSFYRMFKVTPEETVGHLIYDLGNQQWDIPWLRKLLEEVLPQNTTFDDFQVEHVFPTIGRKFMLLNARRICRKDNQTEFILLAIEDTTEHRQAEEARREIESRYTSLVKNMKDHSIFMMDLEGNITTWNSEAQRIIGYAETEILGRNFSVIFTPEDLQCGLPERELRLAREDGRAEDERWHVRKDGSRFWALGIVTPMHDASGNLSGFSKILRDMTERKCAELKLEEQAEALMKADRAKNEFLATLAHELRNPLAPIRNALQIMRLAGGDSDALDQSRAVIERQMQQLVRLVDDLLDLSRISGGKMELRRKRIDLAGVISAALEASRPLIEAGGHELTVALPTEAFRMNADPTRLAQVFLNLLNNAAKYTPHGGHIWLTVELRKGEAVVRIRDTGVGIAAEMLPRIFELFTQVEESLERSHGGLGIGLALVRRLVEMHGGSVEARSEGLGHGSEFLVRLPGSALPTPEQPIESGNNEEVTAAPKRRILVVDDNRDSATSLGMMLSLMGNDTRTAHDGLAAVEAAAAFRPDVMLLDIGLPKLNGYDVCRRIREQPWGKGMVIVALTGWGQEEDKRRSNEAGFSQHMVKPVDPAALEKLLVELDSPP
jgi:PAS domain S-box-containing protein